MTSLGLKDLGYDYINLDDCWNNQTRGPDGKQRSSDVFPDGMKAFGNELHKDGYKFGIYTSQTAKTCAGRAGAYEHEADDTQTYCDWGVDYLKIDLCGGDHYAQVLVHFVHSMFDYLYFYQSS